MILLYLLGLLCAASIALLAFGLRTLQSAMDYSGFRSDRGKKNSPYSSIYISADALHVFGIYQDDSPASYLHEGRRGFYRPEPTPSPLEILKSKVFDGGAIFARLCVIASLS